MPFAADIRHWPNVDAFAAHLAQHDPAICSWVKGLTVHHTYRPLPVQWGGYANMIGLRDFYIGKDWDAGPHLVLVIGAPNPANDGIWQLTPLNVPGIHAGRCNKDHWGIEIAGDYDKAPWPAPLADLVYGTGGALLRWRGLAVTHDTVTGHRECLNNKTCPGSAIHLDDVRAEFARRMLAAVPVDTDVITANSSILAPARCTQSQATQYLIAQSHPNYTSADITLNIVPAYFTLCPTVGVDPCGAIAQVAQEGALSSFWGARPQRNPAGIGVNGDHSDTKPADTTGWQFNTQRNQWERGISFPSWAGHGVPAQIGRLVAWATKPSERTAAQQQLVDVAMKVRDLPLEKHGTSPTLAGLGGPGRWAADEGYGGRVAARAEAMRHL